MAGLDGGDFFDGDGNIGTVLSHDLVASRFDHGGGGRSQSHMGSQTVNSRVGQELRISFGLSLALFQNKSGSGNGSGGAVLFHDFFTLLFISDFLAGDIGGGADIFDSGSASLDLNFFLDGSADGDNGIVDDGGNVRVAERMSGIELRVSLGFGLRGGRDSADQAKNGNLWVENIVKMTEN